jgi:hypothetical protein
MFLYRYEYYDRHIYLCHQYQKMYFQLLKILRGYVGFVKHNRATTQYVQMGTGNYV